MQSMNSVLIPLIIVLIFTFVLSVINSFFIFKVLKDKALLKKDKEKISVKEEKNGKTIGMPTEMKSQDNNISEISYDFTELDVYDELEHTEKDPDKLLKILEYGLPDEELESIIKKLENGE